MSPNAELVTAIFEEVAKGNGAPFWEAASDDLLWRTIGSGDWSGEFRGKETIINEIFRPLRRRLASQITTATRIIDGGDVIAVQARGKAVTHEGQAYDNDYCFVIRFKDGQMVEYEEYCDTQLIASVLGDRPTA